MTHELQRQIEQMKPSIAQLKTSAEAMNQQITQLKASSETMNQQISQLKSKNEAREPPNAFVLLIYYHHHNDDTLPDIFYEFSERVHEMNVTALEDITPGARTTLTALNALMSGPHGDEIKLLIYLWAVCAGLGKKLKMLTYPIPNFAFALEVLRQLIPDPDRQSLMERILPSLVEEVAFSEHIKYFVH
ncbi:hypothetical protein ARMGADRAFT_1065477 [Armillaria gallica]|uniref:Uncharacterized protein n=1 Tax=Armillaria gallica TaxID=47427 RepID=A0A2H3D406_ARMGA|nr:hypothetical protein ARMGADRAFT_1065477 [Armillaria gallica]